MLLAQFPLLVVLAWAAVQDVRTRRIPTALTLTLLATGLLQSLGPAPTVTFVQSMAGLAVGFCLTFLPFAIGALGGGDVKLMAAAGAWLGAPGTLELFCAAAVIAMVMTVAQALAQRRGRALCRSTAGVAISLVHVRQLGASHAADVAKTGGAVARPLPYAVPVLLAAVALNMVGVLR
jgi:prepilin peptidase CpaA